MKQPTVAEDPRRLRSQLSRIADAAEKVLRGVFTSPYPADRLLAAYFRANRACGSHDRALISRGVFALLRFWGWCRRFLPDEKLRRIESGGHALDDEQLAGLVAGALWIDGEEKAFAAAAFRLLGLEAPEFASDPAGRAAAAAAVFGAAHEFCMTELVPERLLEALPEDFAREKFLAALIRRPPLWLRIQSGDGGARLFAELDALKVKYTCHDTVPGAAAIPDARLNLLSLQSFLAGDFEIQDLGSQCIGLIAAPAPGQRWLDACAGAGGKTLQLASLMKRRGVVTAGDIRSGALDELRRRARRAGFPNIQTRPHAGHFWRGGHAYDGVLIDAPCSGSGVWRRNPGGPWRFDPAAVAGFAARQRKILDSFADAVKPGGVLVYATCSIFPAENEEVIEAFLAAHRDFVPDGFVDPLSGERMLGSTRIDWRSGDCDGFFAARCRRRRTAGPRTEEAEK